VGSGVPLCPLGTAATNRPIVPAPGDYDDGEIVYLQTYVKYVPFHYAIARPQFAGNSLQI
jgi:hypothetical protein